MTMKSTIYPVVGQTREAQVYRIIAPIIVFLHVALNGRNGGDTLMMTSYSLTAHLVETFLIMSIKTTSSGPRSENKTILWIKIHIMEYRYS